MTIKKPEVILSVSVNSAYDYKAQQKGKPITEDGRIGEHTVAELVSDIREIVTEKLPQDIASIFGIPVKTRFISVRYGSVTVFFGAALSGLTLIKSYKSFFDSIKLIKEHCELLVKGLARSKYGQDLDVTVSTEHPTLEDPQDSYPPRRLLTMFKRGFPPEIAEGMMELGALYQGRRASRDAFFWFLLVFCAVLLIALGVLVYAAVTRTYFA